MISLLFFLHSSHSPKRGSKKGTKKLHYLEIESLYYSPNIARLIKHKRSAEHTAETRQPYKTFIAKVKERDYLKQTQAQKK